MEFVENRVPGSVELSDRIVVLKGKGVATAVTSGELRVHTAQSMHRLMHITQIVDQETEGV